MKALRSIESKHGVNEPGYEPPSGAEPVEPINELRPVGYLEIVSSFVIPIAGVMFAVMRFLDEEIGPGLACLLIGAVGLIFWLWLLTNLI